MRRFTQSLIVLWYGSLLASYIGNPALPDLPEYGIFIKEDAPLGFSASYIGEYCFSKKMQWQDGPFAKVNESKYFLQMGEVSFNFINRLEPYFALGVSSFDIEDNRGPLGKVDLETKNNFTWKVGSRVCLLYFKKLALGLDASFLKTNSHVDVLKINKIKVKKPKNFSYDQWQVSMGITYPLQWFHPYVGLSYQSFRSKIQNLELEPKNHMGPYVGFTINQNKLGSLSIEGRFVNETAITLDAKLRF